MMRKLATAAMLALSPAVAAAQGVAQCVPQEQAAALVTFALPTLVTQLAGRCRTELPPNAYLVVNAQALADRYRPDADAAWPVARTAIGGLFSKFLGQPMPPDMNGDMLRLLVEPALGALLAKQVRTDDCMTADMAVGSVAALRGRDLGRLTALAAAVADRKNAGIAGLLRVCKPGEQR